MATKYWVGGGASTNWNATSNTNWSDSDGGANNATAPTTGDDVIFNNNSGTGASVWNTSISLNSLVCTASRNLVSGASSVTITISGGNLDLPGGSGATYTAQTNYTFTGTSGTQTITTRGYTIGALVLNGSGGTFQLQDALNTSISVSTTITLTAGTFDCQTFTVSAPEFISTGAATRALKGSGGWTLGTSNFAGNIWNVTASLTVTNFSSTVIITGTTNSGRAWVGAGLSYGPLVIGANTSGGVFSITGANTFSNLTITGPNYISFPVGVTNTISNAFNWTGSAGAPILVTANNFSGTSIATISVTSGTCNAYWTILAGSTATGGATFNAYNSYGLNTSGWTVKGPPATRSQQAQGKY